MPARAPPLSGLALVIRTIPLSVLYGHVIIRGQMWARGQGRLIYRACVRPRPCTSRQFLEQRQFHAYRLSLSHPRSSPPGRENTIYIGDRRKSSLSVPRLRRGERERRMTLRISSQDFSFLFDGGGFTRLC